MEIQLSDINTGDNLENLHHSGEYIIYPNPATDNINISFYLEDRSDIKIEFFNLSGKLISGYTLLNRNTGENHFQFNLDEYEQGVYLIKVTTNRNTKLLKFILLQ